MEGATVHPGVEFYVINTSSTVIIPNAAILKLTLVVSPFVQSTPFLLYNNPHSSM